MDALAVLENARFQWLRGKQGESRQNDSLPNHVDFDHGIVGSADDHPFSRSITVAEAVAMARNAVQAGILNDLGSGSHVDLCIIRREGVQQWRERLINPRDQRKKGPVDEPPVRAPPEAIEGQHGVMLDGKGEEEHNVAVLGRCIYTRLHRTRVLRAGVLRDEWRKCGDLQTDLAMDMEILN